MKVLVGIVLSLILSIGYAGATDEPIQEEEAFSLSAHLTKDNELTLQWTMPRGYYLYRDKLSVELAPDSQVKLGSYRLPEGAGKQDTIRGTYQIYSGNLKLNVRLEDIHKGFLHLRIGYQGCSTYGFCYSPIKKSLEVNLLKMNAPANLTNHLTLITSSTTISDEAYAKNIFMGKNIFVITFAFLGFGLLLAFTPCVLPMVPILSGIIIGHKKRTHSLKTFFLSLAYVLGMALTYAIAGIVVALIGSHIQTELQRPWVIVLFSALFFLLALSLFGFYELQMPSHFRQRLNKWSNKQKGGSYVGVFFMGSISSLIVSPCISPPLVGALAYIAETGDVWLGALALFALGIGMGIPLLIIGVSAGQLLPKAGPFMQTIERLMGIILLGFAIWLLSRVIPGPLTLFLWAALLMGSAIFIVYGNNKLWFRRSIALVLFIYGIILILGAFVGNTEFFHPWDNGRFTARMNKNTMTLKNMEQLDQLLSQSKKPVILDFYADWCESCIRIEHDVLREPEVQDALADFVLLRADVTAHNEFDQALLKRFHVIAPPLFLFFDLHGKELRNERIIGEVNAANFLSHVTRISEKES